MLSYFLLLPVAALAVLLIFGRSLWRYPVVRWMIGGIVVGAAGTAGLTLYGIFRSTSSTTAIGILFVPFAMVFGGAVGAIAGFAAFQAAHLGERMRQGVRSGAIAVASVALLAFCLTYAFYQARRIQTFHRYQRADSAETLAVEADRYRQAKDYFILSAIAANARTPPDALLRIARDPDPGLHHKRGEWINMFDRDQLAVMRKVVRNPNSPVDALVNIGGLAG